MRWRGRRRREEKEMEGAKYGPLYGQRVDIEAGVQRGRGDGGGQREMREGYGR